MKAKIVTIVLVVLLLIAVIICALNMRKEKSTKYNIATSFYPVYIATLNIVEKAEDVTVTNITKDVNGCLHDYALTTEELVSLSNANALVINGASMEGFMDKVISNYPNLKIIDSSSLIDLIEEEEDVEDNHEEGHHHEVNSHIFASVSNYIKQVENITEGLVQINPENKEIYIKNKDEYIRKLELLKEEIKESMDSLKNKNIVTFHDSFDYFAKEFGLNVITTIENEHGLSPSAKEMAEIITKIKEEHVKAIFIEPDSNAKIAEMVANETGTKIYTLNPVTSGKDDLDEYINIMRDNLATLKEALS